MPIPVVALFAAGIYQERALLSDTDPAEEVRRTASLLARATGDAGLSLEICGEDLLANGLPLSLNAPGAAVIRHALVDHHTARLTLPRALTASQWREVIAVYASVPGLYHSIDDLRDAVRFSVPDAVVAGTSGLASEGDLRQALFELPGLRASSGELKPSRVTNPHDAELADLSAHLDPLLTAAALARDAHNYQELAQILAQITDIAAAIHDDRRAIVARERRRVVPPDVLETMARLIPKAGTSPVVARVLGQLGHDGAVALIGALSGAPGAQERRAYIDALVGCRDCEAALLEALANDRSELARDAAEVVGRKRIERAVPRLALLLRHSRVDVRTTAWHALETIGTRDAMKAMRA